MAKPQSNLDELMKDPKAAGLLKNKDLLKNILSSPDTNRLMNLLNQNAGGGRQRGSQPAHRAAQSGDAEQGGGPGSGASHRHSAQKVSVPGKEARAHG